MTGQKHLWVAETVAGVLRLSPEANKRPSGIRWAASALAIVGLLGMNRCLSHLPTSISGPKVAVSTAGTESSPWTDIEPSPTLRWHQCYDDKYDCARLEVPMDWQSPSHERVVLAIIRLNATDRADYRGPIFFNPGGPGGSAIWSMLDHGDLIQRIAGTNHDIIGFDTRGVGASTPLINCWPSDQERTFWDLTDVGVSDSHPGMIYDEYYRAYATSQRCEVTMAESGLLHHIGTASHARDMLEILQQTGQDRLRYWGFSYGTVLGGTFAAMYPDKIERLVSDGNVDLGEWYSNVHVNFLRDADKVLQAFYDLCADAGPQLCAFHAATPAAVEQRLHALLDTLRRHPVLVAAGADAADGGPEMPEAVTYSKARRLVAAALYQPLRQFAALARVLAALERRDGVPYYRAAEAGMQPLSSFCYAARADAPPVVEDTADAFPAISCADAQPWTGSVDDFVAVADHLANISWALGAVSTRLRAMCAGRTVRPKWRFDGPLQAKTSFPILFVANAADNMTPLVSARNNSARFEGSAVLVQNSLGHTTLSAPSTCTARHIRRYFQEGVLPGPDAECEPDQVPFGVYAAPAAVEEADADLADATRRLSLRAGSRLGRRSGWMW